MTIKTAVVQAVARATTGLQDITVADFGTPKGAIFVCNMGVTNGVNVNPMSQSFGAADPVNQFMVCGVSVDAVATSATRRKGNLFEVIHLLGGAFGTTDIAVADFVSFVTDGVRVNWTDSSGNGELVTVVLFAGDDLDFAVGEFTVPAGDGSTVNVDIGFVPDLFIGMGMGGDLDDVTDTGPNLSLGAASNKSPIVQGCVATVHRSGQASSEVRGGYSPNRVGLNINSNANSVNRSVELTDFISSPVQGVELTLRAGTGSTTAIGGFVAIKTNGVADFWVDNALLAPNSTGNESVTDPGFKPQLVFLLQGVKTNPIIITGDGQLSFGAFTPTVEVSNGYWDKDGVGTTDTGSYVDQKAVYISDEDGVTFIEASFVSMDDNGFTLDYTTVDIFMHLFVGVAIGEVDVTPTPTPDLTQYGQVILKPTGPEYGQPIGETDDTVPQYGQVIAVDPRPEYGQEFRKDSDQEYGQRIVRD